MFDASAFFGAWAFRNNTARSLHEVCTQLAQHGIQGAALSPLEALLHPEPMSANRKFLQQLTSESGFATTVYPVPIIDPTLATWSDHIKECLDLADGRLKAFKLAPAYHGYNFSLPALHSLVDMLAGQNLNVCLQLRMEDERTRHVTAQANPLLATDFAEFAKDRPQVQFLACAPYLGELNAFSEAANISAEMSFVESGHLLRDALQRLDNKHLLMGTHAPLFMPAVGASKVFADKLDQNTHYLISTGNFKSIFA